MKIRLQKKTKKTRGNRPAYGRVSMQLGDDRRDRVEALCRESDHTMSEIIRQAVDFYLDNVEVTE